MGVDNKEEEAVTLGDTDLRRGESFSCCFDIGGGGGGGISASDDIILSSLSVIFLGKYLYVLRCIV